MRKTFSILVALVLATQIITTQVSANENDETKKFGKTVRRIVFDDLPTAKCLIDFDNGKVAKPPSKQPRSDKDAVKYFTKSGFDAIGEGDHLVGVAMIAKTVPNSFWDAPKDIEKQLKNEKPETPLRIRHAGNFPCTFVIKTQNGGIGVMRFTKPVPAKNGAPAGLELEYKLLEQAGTDVAKTGD